jgi:hypothetical protein
MGFANAAAYFESRAHKARDLDEKQRLTEIAGFYRRLAGITSDYPPGYKANGATGRASRWKARAEECRAIADGLSHPQSRAQMLDLADTYAVMAKAAE